MSNNNIIYSERMPVFLNEAFNDAQALANKIQNGFNRIGYYKVSGSEKESWENSLPRIAKLLKSKEFVNDDRVVLIEFAIPIGKKRIDFIVLGETNEKYPAAYIIELKQWSQSKTIEIEDNRFQTGIYTSDHPSYQVSNYQRTLDEVMGLKKLITLKSAVYLHNFSNNRHKLFDNKYQNLLKLAYIYHTFSENELYNDISRHVSVYKGDKALDIFANMRWNPTEDFWKKIAKEKEEINLAPSQQEIFDTISRYVKVRLTKQHGLKQTFIIKGNPGSGKSIIAFKLLHELQSEFQNKDYPIKLIIPGGELRDAIKEIMKDKNLSAHIGGAIVENYKAAIIDEGHKAVSQNYGKQNYREMYKKLDFAVILIDDAQVINQRGMTAQDVAEIARANGHEVIEREIEENFRNKGEVALLNWIDYVFYNRSTADKNTNYELREYKNAAWNYKLHGYKNDDAFVNSYYDYYELKNEKTRLVSLWHEEWYTGEAENGELPLHVAIGKYAFAWNPNDNWLKQIKKVNREALDTYSSELKNYARSPKSFILGQKNLKREYVAYFNHVQGSEFDHIFVYIPKIFTYEKNEIKFHYDRLGAEVKRDAKVFKKIPKSAKSQTKIDQIIAENNQIYIQNKTYFLNRIKVMLTRGTKSTHVYAEDQALNEYINSKIIP